MKTKLHLCFTILFLSASLAFSQWIQVGADIDGEGFEHYSGISGSLSSDGTIVAIGTPYDDDGASNSGHVRIYQLDGVNWNQLGQDIDGEASQDYSADSGSVSLSGDGTIVAIGAYQNDGNGNQSGHVRIYQWDGVSWNQLGTDIDGEAAVDLSGSVSLSSDGSRLAVGARNNGGGGKGSGHVRIYQWDGVSWNQLGADIDGEAIDNFSGSSVSLSSDGNTVAIGAYHNDDNGLSSGHVRIYQFDGVSWNQLGQDIDGEAAQDLSGRVSLSGDGARVAIGAYQNDGNGSNSGHVRVYEYDGAAWNQLGQDIDGEAAHDHFGRKVSLSSNGSIVAIGATWNDGIGVDSGHVRVYEYDGAAWNQLGTDIDGEGAG